MNRKGFTLIELLAVILILSTISVVAVVSISSSLERRDSKECEEQVALAKNAAKIYFSLHGYNEAGVSIECLIGSNDEECNESYLEPKKTDKLDKNFVIKIDRASYSYKVYAGSNEFKCSQS